MRRLNSSFRIALFVVVSICSAFAQTNIITTVAGGGMQNNIPGLSADLPIVSAVAVNRVGNVYIESAGLNQVFRLNSSG